MYVPCMLDETDLALVHALQEAPRAPWSALAACLDADKRTLISRYNRLREAGLLRVMATSGPRLIERQLFAHLRIRTAPGRGDVVAAELAKWPQASTIRMTDGSCEVYAFLLGAEHSDLIRAARQRLAGIRHVRDAEINTVLRAGDVGRAARLDALSPQQVSRLRDLRHRGGRRSAAQPARLVEDDFALLRLLLQDGRLEIVELAARLGRDPSAISRRLARLRRDAFVDFVALIPDSAWSSPVRALLWCSVAPQHVEPLTRRAASLPWVGMMTVTTGRANVFVVANVKTRTALPAVQEELGVLCPSLTLLETQLSPQAVRLHMRGTSDGDRLTDEVADPFWELRHALARV